jgi:hypothetical protein
MSERDAFGRRRDEDTLASMGWREPAFVATLEGTTSARAPETAEQPVVTPALPPPPSPAARAPSRPRRHRRRPRVMSRLLFTAIVAAGLLIGLRSGTGVLDGLEDALRGQADAITRTVPVEGGSLLRADALSAALAGLPDGDVEYLRVSRDRIEAQVVAGGRLHNVRVTAAGRVFDIPTPARGRGAALRVNPRAPARIVRTAARRAGRRVSSVSYLMLLDLGGRSVWQLVFDDGLRYTADASGRKVRRTAR